MSARASLALNLSVATTLFSCGGSPLEPRYVAVHNAMTSMGYDQLGAIQEGTLAETTEVRTPLTLPPGACYAITAIGEGSVQDLDLVIFDALGRETARDRDVGAQPSVQFCPRDVAPVTLAVHMTRGNGRYLIATYQGGAGAGGAMPNTRPTNEVAARPAHGGAGTCDEPHRIEVGATVTGNTTNGDSVTSGTCAPGNAPEVVYAFEIARRSLVRARMQSAAFDGALYVLGACGEPRSEVICNDDSAPGDTSQSDVEYILEPGRYYLVADGYASAEGEFQLSLSASETRPPAEICQAATVLPIGRTIAGSTNEGADTFQATCAGDAHSADQVYSLNIEQASRVRINMQSTFDGALYLRRMCADPRSEIVCNDDAPDTRHSQITTTLEPGQYFVFADGFGQGARGDYSLRVDAVSAAGNGENGDTCAAPAMPQAVAQPALQQGHSNAPAVLPPARALSPQPQPAQAPQPQSRSNLGPNPSHKIVAPNRVPAPRVIAPTAGVSTYDIVADTFPAGDQYHGSCGGQGAPDVVYRVDIRARSRVRLSATTSDFPAIIYLERNCGDATTEIACASTQLLGPQANVLDQTLAPGSYFLVVDGADANAIGSFRARLVIEDIAAGERMCTEGLSIRPGQQIRSSTQGLPNRFQGSCTHGESSDQVFRLTVRRRGRVRISSEQTDFDGALYIRTACGPSGTEIACNDDAGDARHSMIDTQLEPGTYYVIVDGYADNQQGEFTLDVDAGDARVDRAR